MRNMSFSLTSELVIAGTKDVTRRIGWKFAKAGDLICPVRKNRGLRPGERIEILRGPIRLVSVRQEPLRLMLDDLAYGHAECAREGYRDHPTLGNPSGFIAMFCATHKGCTPDSTVTRLEFTYEVGS